MDQNTPSSSTYVFELSEEARRLERQGHFVERFSRRFLETAGITTGMKVLEVGSGAGDVALLLAERVGQSGSVVGVEINPSLLQIAHQRVQAAGWSNVSFVEGDICTVALPDTFDAIVGRFILIHIQDKVALLRRLAAFLRPGGIIAFQEPDFTHLGTAWPPAPLFTQVFKWISEAARRGGLDLHTGLALYSLFLDAGLPEPEMELMTAVGGGPHWAGYEGATDVVSSLLPLILKLGIASAEEVQIETLAERLREEMSRQRGAVMAVSLLSAWTRKA